MIKQRTVAVSLLVTVCALSACSGGPSIDPPAVVITPPPSAPHRGPLELQIDPDMTGSYPDSLMQAFIKEMADWIQKLPAVNTDQTTVYVTYINSEPYLPASSPLTFTIPAVPNWPALPAQKPIPSCPANPYTCSDAQATDTALNTQVNTQYQHQLTAVQQQLAAAQQATTQQTQKMQALHPGVDNVATSIWGVLNLASQRFKGAAGEKWLILGTDLGNNEQIDHIPPDLTGVHVMVMNLYCTSAIACQATKNTWTGIFTRAHAASITFLDPEASQASSSPWS